RFRAKTGELNKLIRAAIKNAPPPTRMNRTARVLYATQVATEPPTIVIKCNSAELFDEDYKRYLLGVLRERLPFKEVPIKLYFRSKADDHEKGEREEAISSAVDRGVNLDEFEDELLGVDLDD